jgi:hypothetical protein
MGTTPTIPFWNYQSGYAWTSTDGILTDQSRLWIQALYRRVMSTTSGGGFTAGGDLSGTNTNQTVIGLQTRHVSTTAPTNGQVLTWSSVNNDWEPQTLTASVNFVREVPAGVLDGSNQTFTLSFTPNPAASLTLFLNGVEQVPATDYAISGATISYLVAPKVSDLMIAIYTH